MNRQEVEAAVGAQFERAALLAFPLPCVEAVMAVIDKTVYEAEIRGAIGALRQYAEAIERYPDAVVNFDSVAVALRASSQRIRAAHDAGVFKPWSPTDVTLDT